MFVPLIASNVALRSPKIAPLDTCSSLVDDVASGLTPAILHLQVIVVVFNIFIVVVTPFSDVY